MNKVLNPYYTINVSLLLEYDKNNPPFVGTKLNILVNELSELTPYLYSILGSIENEYIISLSASLLQQPNAIASLLPQIYLLTVLNGSSKSQKIIPIFWDDAQQEIVLNIDLIQSYFNQQGLNDSKFPIFNYSISGSQVIGNCCCFMLQENSIDSPNVFSGDNENVTTIVIASKPPIISLTALDSLKKQINADEKYNFLSANFSKYYIEKEAVEMEIALWQKRTLLYQEFLSLSKKVQESEYYEVINWYNTEYEVLPLWYKRLGHIIKVIMGKRSFRSLYNDNVKKYKD